MCSCAVSVGGVEALAFMAKENRDSIMDREEHPSVC